MLQLMMLTAMRKPSEIIALAVADKRYVPMYEGFDPNKYEYLCLLLKHMDIHEEITEAERIEAVRAIRARLQPCASLTAYIICELGIEFLNQRQFMHFWDQFIQTLQSQGR